MSEPVDPCKIDWRSCSKNLQVATAHYRTALPVRTKFKKEQLPIVWSRALYRTRLFLLDE
jgi:hypothetical protein